MIYADSSALMKLVVEEAESAALAHWFEMRRDVPVVTSELTTVELLRASRQVDPDALARARRLLDGIDRIPLSTDVLGAASLADPPGLGSLDAVQLASALALQDELSAFVTYDERLASAAVDAGLEVVGPR